jgi:hypothetical protein
LRRRRGPNSFANSRPITVRFANDIFVGDPDDPDGYFVVLTDEPDEYYFVWGIGLAAQFGHSVSAFIDYENIAGLDQITSHEISFGVRVQTEW